MNFAQQLNSIAQNYDPALLKKYDEEQKERQKAHAERKARSRKSLKLTKDQVVQVIKFLKSDHVFLNRMRNDILKETQMGQTVRNAFHQQSLRRQHELVAQFKQRMTNLIQDKFVIFQNKFTQSMKSLLLHKTELLKKILAEKNYDNNQALKGVIQNIILEVANQAKKAQIITTHLHQYYESMGTLMIDQIKTNVAHSDSISQLCFTSMKEQMQKIESHYIEKLATDVTKSYEVCLQQLVQIK